MNGTLFNISVNPEDGLVSWDAPNVALTWMDAVVDGKPVTPRRGKPIEINALWYSAVCWASNWAKRFDTDAEIERMQNHLEQVKGAMQKYWNPSAGYLYDTIAPGDCALRRRSHRPNAQIRPNAILALSLHHCAFPRTQARQIVDVATSKLLTPYGLRSLAPDDPEYIGTYGGSAQERNRADHQGTVWRLIGLFIRASMRNAQPLAIKLRLLEHLNSQACIGSISEIFDGDPPHTPQGAIAQAWSIAEVIRHFSNAKF